MGQYYRPCLLAPDFKENNQNPVLATADCYFYANGAKLMEHSWVGNWFVAAACTFLFKNKTFPFVWCGDYADAPSDIYKGVDEKGEEWENNMYRYACAGDFDTKYSQDVIGEMTEARYAELEPKMKYIINHSKKEYVVIPEKKEDEWTIHPLPLLTADGNGAGGGDYHRGTDMNKVGIWAYDIIEVGDEIPEGYTELKVDFKED